MSTIEIVESGWATTIQDAGRPGFAALGVPHAGPVDRARHAVANRVVGNVPHAAAFETAGGLVVRADGPAIVFVTDDVERRTLRAGDSIEVAPGGRDGDRWRYLAVRGGLDVPHVLGSASHDTLAGLGPSPLAPGQRYVLGSDPHTDLLTDYAPLPRQGGVVSVWSGPQVSRFEGDLDQLTTRSWVVSDDVSRVGVRFRAQPFARRSDQPLASAGLVEGAVQVTPSGEPIVMLANHPTTGGYPVIAVVDPADLPIVAQANPGDQLRFRAVRR
ncbi:MAG: biotin-dependent carboxyltransferase family protein [Actinomycetota bacterium]